MCYLCMYAPRPAILRTGKAGGESFPQKLFKKNQKMFLVKIYLLCFMCLGCCFNCYMYY